MGHCGAGALSKCMCYRHWRGLWSFRSQVERSLTPVLELIESISADVQSEDLSHWRLYGVAGLALTQCCVSIVEGHDEVPNRSHIVNTTLQSVMYEDDGCLFWRLVYSYRQVVTTPVAVSFCVVAHGRWFPISHTVNVPKYHGPMFSLPSNKWLQMNLVSLASLLTCNAPDSGMVTIPHHQPGRAEFGFIYTGVITTGPMEPAHDSHQRPNQKH